VNFRTRLPSAIAGALMVGPLLGAVDAALALALGGSASQAPGAVVVAALAAGLVGAFLSAFVVAPLVAARDWGRVRRPLGTLCLLVGLAAMVADARVLVRLYPEAHLLLGTGALLAATAGGALWVPPAWPAARPVVLGAVLAALGAQLAGPAALGDDPVRWQAALGETTLTARVAGALWGGPADAAPPAERCDWPGPQPTTSAGASMVAQHDILLVTVDALRADLDLRRLMPETVRRLDSGQPAFFFPNAYAPAVRTNRSTYSLLTGRWPHALRFDTGAAFEDGGVGPFPRADPRLHDPRSWKLRHPLPFKDATPTLAGLLGRAGYTTATAVGYVFLQPAGGITREFARFDVRPYRDHNRDKRGITAEPMTDAGLGLIADAPAPWFLWSHYMDPHNPYEPYGDVGADAPPRARYEAEIRRVDAAVARLLDGVDLSRTVVALTSDHGEEFGDHGGLFHGTTVYEELIRVPLWLRVPGVAGREIDARTSLVDLAPTLLELVGAVGSTPFDGRSLVPVLRGADPTPRPILASATLHGFTMAVLDGDWKLVEGAGSPVVELYALGGDPGERRNLVSAHPEVVSRLRCMLRRALAEAPSGAAPSGESPTGVQ
jgi:arylsulfatase A-like enzyme